ncbi:thymidine phosphorylase, partial [Loktanella sp. SALINAS62]|uniref:thymidine phosphorylase n=1 Tax=Loktanella sp. SALINAS62 TaxID=2706124 RepID=UPI0020132D41
GGIAPADRRLYAIRDVTATVASVDLITASILSKKLAAGLGAMVLDVKVGSGAFMKSQDDAAALARALVDTANGAGCPTAALLSDMNQPLAPALGNATEVAICIDLLEGNTAHAPRLLDLCLSLGEAVLTLAGQGDGARARLTGALHSGQAMERFARMIHALGGPPDMGEDWRTHLPDAPVVVPLPAWSDGHIARIDGEALGLAVVVLGGGRAVEHDRIDPAVGLTAVARLGQRVSLGDPVATVHARTRDDADRAAAAVRAAITLGDAPIEAPLILDRILT